MPDELVIIDKSTGILFWFAKLSRFLSPGIISDDIVYGRVWYCTKYEIFITLCDTVYIEDT